MPNITITGGSVCPGGNHRTITTDLAEPHDKLNLLNSEFAEARTGGLAELRDDFLAVVTHTYKTSRAAGRTHNQALQDLVGLVVRL